jgi:hypothetical protein
MLASVGGVDEAFRNKAGCCVADASNDDAERETVCAFK